MKISNHYIMKIKYIVQIYLLLSTTCLFAQGMLNKGSDIKIKADTYIKIKNAGFANKVANTTVNNSGTITVGGLLDNYGTISGNLVIESSTGQHAAGQINNGVNNSNNAIGTPGTNFASIGNNDNIELDLGQVVSAGTIIEITIARNGTNSNITEQLISEAITSGGAFSNVQLYTSTVNTVTGPEIFSYQLGADAQYILIERQLRSAALYGLTYTLNTSNIRLGIVESIEINTSSTLNILDQCSISKLLKISSGDLNTNSQTVKLLSNAGGTALVDHNGGNTLGDFEVQRYISTANGHHFISSPTSNASIQQLSDDFPLNLSGGFPHVYYYEETSTATTAALRWKAPTTFNHPMQAGEGFTFWFNTNSGKTIDINGPINNGLITIPMTFTHSIPVSSNINGPYSPEGWNFIGNPYAAPLDYNLLIAAAPNVVAHGMYRWDPNTSTYISYINGISNPANYNAIIPSMQGFWLRTSANCNLTMDNSMRVTDPDAVSNIFLKQSNNDPLSRLELVGMGKKIETVLTFNPYATNNYDPQLDAYFLGSDEPDEIIIASIAGQRTLSINSLATLPATNQVIPLHYKITSAGNYSIQISELLHFPVGSILILEDQQLSTTKILNEGPYSFLGNPNDDVHRFRLNVVPDANNIRLIEEKNTIKMYVHQNDLILETMTATEQDQVLQISDVVGRIVFERILMAGQTTFQVSVHNLPKNQLYVATLKDANYSYTFTR